MARWQDKDEVDSQVNTLSRRIASTQSQFDLEREAYLKGKKMTQIANDIETLVAHDALLTHKNRFGDGIFAPSDAQAEAVYDIYRRWGLDPQSCSVVDAIEALRMEQLQGNCGHELHDNGDHAVCVRCGFVTD